MISLLLAKDVRPPNPSQPLPTNLKNNEQVYGYLFSNDESVVHLVSQVMPLVASFQVADGLAGSCGGVLRGQGRQHLGAAFNLVAYYVLALPLGIALAFHWGYGLPGLWIGTYTLLFSFLFAYPFHACMHACVTFTLMPPDYLTYRPGRGTFYRGYVRVCGRVAWHGLGSRSRERGLA
jgi:MatE